MTTAHSIFQRVVAISVRAYEDGQDFAEYAVILGLVVLVGAAGISNFGTALGTLAMNAAGAVIAFM
jgi:Flp pilus assembly pilin Flp